VFNLLNHTNFGSYTLNESNGRFGQPAVNTNIWELPRIVQLGFRITF
jgi:hypothetical protein